MFWVSIGKKSWLASSQKVNNILFVILLSDVRSDPFKVFVDPKDALAGVSASFSKVVDSFVLITRFFFVEIAEEILVNFKSDFD